MALVMIIGCGDLGGAVAQGLIARNHQVVAVRYQKIALPAPIQTVFCDITQPACIETLAQFQPDYLIYCVAASAQNDENYYQHYVLGLQHALSAQANNTRLQHVFFVSSTRVYGQVTNQLLDETTPAQPADFGGLRLLEAEQLLNGFKTPKTVLRLSGIYGKNRLYLINLAREPARWAAQNSWTNRIHRDDAAEFMIYLITQKQAQNQANVAIEDSYIVTDSQPVSQHEVLRWLANQLQITVPNTTILPPLAGKRLSNQRMLDSGFKLRYPNYQAGYQSILNSL